MRLVGVDLVQLALDPVAMGTYFGMLLGKPLGIVGVTFLLVRSSIADMPKNVTGAHILGVGILGGIGFTMSILIAAWPSRLSRTRSWLRKPPFWLGR